VDPEAGGGAHARGVLDAADAIDPGEEGLVRLLGYRFQPLDLVSRILAQANYDPSLIQLHGAHLLRRLRKRFGEGGRMGAESGPPYVITQEHVDEVCPGRDLRAAIEQRFSLTLQLDLRYEVIAYAIAHGVIENRIRPDQGALPGQLRMDALYWWAEGFENTSSAESVALMELMPWHERRAV
jgi:hypothetical protein